MPRASATKAKPLKPIARREPHDLQLRAEEEWPEFDEAQVLFLERIFPVRAPRPGQDRDESMYEAGQASVPQAIRSAMQIKRAEAQEA